MYIETKYGDQNIYFIIIIYCSGLTSLSNIYTESKYGGQIEYLLFKTNLIKMSKLKYFLRMVCLSFSLEVLATLTTDVGKVLTCLHKVQPQGDGHFVTGVKKAHVRKTLCKYVEICICLYIFITR